MTAPEQNYSITLRMRGQSRTRDAAILAALHPSATARMNGLATASNRARPNDDETDFIFLTATRIEAEWMKAKLESALRRTGFAGMVRIRSLRGGLAG